MGDGGEERVHLAELGGCDGGGDTLIGMVQSQTDSQRCFLEISSSEEWRMGSEN